MTDDSGPPASVTPELFAQWRAARYGAGNPERVTNPVWVWLARHPEITAYQADKHFGGGGPMRAGAGWTNQRFGQTSTVFSSTLSSHAGHGAQPHLYFEAAAAIISFVLLGKLLETRARKRLSDAVRGLVALVPKTARRVNADGTTTDVDVTGLSIGDRVVVRPG